MIDLTAAEEVARTVVLDLSPAEQDYFPVAVAQAREDPGKKPRTARADTELGMGAILGIALSPLVLWTVHKVIEVAAGLVVEAGVKRSSGLRGRFARWLARLPVLRRVLPKRRLPGPEVLAGLDVEGLRTVREAARSEALAAGVAEPLATQLADAVVGRLLAAATGTPAGTEPPTPPTP